MSKRYSQPRKTRAARQTETERALVIVKRTGRRVRLAIQMKPDLQFTGKANEATYAYADLDDVQVERITGRMLRVRGGRKTL